MTQQTKSNVRQMTRLSTILTKLAHTDDDNRVRFSYYNSGPRSRRYECWIERDGIEVVKTASNYDLAARRLAYALHLIPRSEVNPQGGEKNG